MISKKVAKRFAALYVNGTAEFKGKWDRCAQWLGFRAIPSLDDPIIAAAIVEAGGRPPALIPPTTSPMHDGATKAEGPDYETISEDETIFDADELIAEAEEHAGKKDDWKQRADRLRDVMEQVAATGGYTLKLADKVVFVKSSAAQVAALKTIFERAEGRVAEKSSAKAQPVGVVMLPSDNFVCPRCGYKNED